MDGGHTLRAVGDVDELREDWSLLAAAAGSPFATPEWAQTWITHVGRADHVHIFAIDDDDGRVVAILPLTRGARWPRVVRFVGHGPGDELGPVCAPGDRPVAVAGLREALGSLRADLLLAEQLPGDRGWDKLLAARPVADTGNPTLSLDAIDDAETLLAGFGRSVGRNFGRTRRKLEQAGELRIRVAVAGAQLDADVDALFALHRARWPGGTDFGGSHEAFHRHFITLAADRGWLWLLFVEVDGVPVAALYDLRFAGAQNQYQQGRDPAWDRASVGFFALLTAMTGAAQDGMSAYRFLRGDEPYKYRYADADPRLQTFVVGRGAAGQAAALAAGSLRRHARPLVRRWLAA